MTGETKKMTWPLKPQLWRFSLAAAGLCAVFAFPLLRLANFALHDELFSYILLIPFACLYLAWLRRSEFPVVSQPEIAWAAVFFVGAVAALAFHFLVVEPGSGIGLASSTLAFILSLNAVGLLFLGNALMRSLAFPFFLLAFMIPLPDGLQLTIEAWLQQGSATVASWLFALTGMNVFRDDLFFHLPGITLQIAPECSGIHSSVVLFILSLVAGNLFLRQPVQRIILCLAVLPLACLRNGFRVFVLGELCTHIGPQIIDSPIHHRGGPIFFALSLIPFSLLLYFLRQSEHPKTSGPHFMGVLFKKSRKFMTSCLLLTALIPLLAGSSGCSAGARKASFERHADQLYAAGELAPAEIQYLNLLRAAPGDPRAIGRLGLIYYQEGRLQTAAPYIIAASKLTTNDLEIRLKLGFIYAAEHRLSDARNEADFVLARNPRDKEAPLLLAQAASTPGEVAAVRARLREMASSTDSAAIETALGTLAFREHDLKNATGYFQRALVLDRNFGPALAGLASLNVAKNDLKNAEIDFRAAAESAAARSPIKLIYARFEFDTGNASAARLILEDMVKRTPDYLPAWTELAEIALSQKDYEKGQAVLRQLLALDPNDFDGLLLDSQLKLVQNNVPSATAELERMARIYSTSPDVHYQLARAYLAANDNAKAAASLQRALTLSPDFLDAAVLLAQIQIQNQQFDSAIFALEQLCQRHPESLSVGILLADAYRQERRNEDALMVYRSLEESFPQNPLPPSLIGSLYADQNDRTDAAREFSRALEIAPDNPTALEQLVNLDLASKQFGSAMQLVRRRLQSAPNQIELYLLEARVYSAEGKSDQARAALMQANKIDPDNLAVYLFLAQIYVDSMQTGHALAQLDKALAKNPEYLPALMLKASVCALNRDYQQEAKIYEGILEKNPGQTLALNNLACLYAQNIPRLDRAFELAERARKLSPHDPAIADTLGWICCLRGSYPYALQMLEESAAESPDDPEIQFHLGMVDYLSGNEDGARTAFRTALQINRVDKFPDRDECKTCLAILAMSPRSTDAVSLATLRQRLIEKPADPIALARRAAIYQSMGISDQAIASYEAALRASPNNPALMLNLAQLYSTKDLSKACALAAAAYKLEPYNHIAVLTYGRLAFQVGQFRLANALLQQAVGDQADNPMMFYDFAWSAYYLGKIAEAKTAMQSALHLNLPAPQAAEARQLLDLVNLAVDPEVAVGADSRVSEILKSQPDYVPALMAAGIIAERNGNVKAAQVDYEKILVRFPDFSPAQRQLAILYARDPNKLSLAYELSSKAIQSYPNDPLLAKVTGIILYKQGKYLPAARMLQATAASLPNDPELYYFLGAAQLKLNEQQAAKASLQKVLSLDFSGKLAESAKQMLAQSK